MKITSRLLALLLITALFAGCKGLSAVDFENLKGGGSSGVGLGGNPIKAGEYYIKGTLDGKAINWQAGNDLTGYLMVPIQGMASGGGTHYGSTQTMFTKVTPVPNISIEFTSIKVEPGEDHAAKFNSFITTGTWQFITDHTPQELHGVDVYYVDEQGNSYGSVGPQTATLKVVSMTKIAANALHGAEIKALVTFSCTLYPDDQRNTSIEFKNAESTILIEDPFFM